MKRWLTLLLTLAMLFPLAACSAPVPAQQTIDLSGAIEGDITVSCYDSFTVKNFLDAAAKGFMEKYPGTNVAVESFSKPPEMKTTEQEGMRAVMITTVDDPQGRQDYINRVSTELMSGGGADIYAMDVLPAYRLANNGQLEDLLKYMEADADFNMADYWANIFDAAKYDGGLYAVPTDYEFEILAYDGALVDDAMRQALLNKDAATYSELTALAEAAFTQKKADDSAVRIWGSSAEEMLGNLIMEDLAKYVDLANKKANFNDGSFVGLLNDVKRLEAMGALGANMQMMRVGGEPGDGPSFDAEGGMDMQELMRQNTAERHFFKSKAPISYLQSLLPEQTMGGARISFGGGGMSVDDDDVNLGLVADANGKIPFESSQSFGLNANSGNKNLAWAFIKYLLSADAQGAGTMGFASLPVNKAAQELSVKRLIQQLTQAAPMRTSDGQAAESAENAGGAGGIMIGRAPEMPEGDVTLDAAQQAIYDEYTKTINAYTEKLNHYNLDDSSVRDMIQEQIRAVFAGEKSAEEAASTLQSKVELYLNE